MTAGIAPLKTLMSSTLRGMADRMALLKIRKGGLRSFTNHCRSFLPAG